mmetsp:Transcript_26806/g.56788  ORF Transcript_26806/g.56788 Transcript_26806/m.56788 type:complete len:81 (-) Transcript_26806:34-276(-)
MSSSNSNNNTIQRAVSKDHTESNLVREATRTHFRRTGIHRDKPHRKEISEHQRRCFRPVPPKKGRPVLRTTWPPEAKPEH